MPTMDAEGLVVEPGAHEGGRLVLAPFAGPQERVSFRKPPGGGHQKREGEFGRGFADPGLWQAADRNLFDRGIGDVDELRAHVHRSD
jgi:hypothetical protein